MVRCDQALDGGRPTVAADPPDPRRAAVRRARRRGRGGQAARVRADGRRVRDGSAAGGRRRDRARLAGGEVSRAQGLAVVALRWRSRRGARRRARARRAGVGASATSATSRTGAELACPLARPMRRTCPYGGGPVMHSNRTHLIFWEPAGSGLTFDPGYQPQIETFLTRCRGRQPHDDERLRLSGQYSDPPARPPMTRPTAARSSTPIRCRPNGCTEPLADRPGVERVPERRASSRPRSSTWSRPTTCRPGRRHVLPRDARTGSAAARRRARRAARSAGERRRGYCGYHSVDADGRSCTRSSRTTPSPGTASRTTRARTEHRRPGDLDDQPRAQRDGHRSARRRLVDRSGNEDRRPVHDAAIGPSLGGSRPRVAWNEVIDGGHYYIQEVWSNCAHGVRAARRGRTRSRSRSPRRRGRERLLAFTGHGADPEGKIIGPSAGSSATADRRPRRAVEHTFRAAGSVRGRRCGSPTAGATGRTRRARFTSIAGRVGAARASAAAPAALRPARPGRRRGAGARATNSGWAMFEVVAEGPVDEPLAPPSRAAPPAATAARRAGRAAARAASTERQARARR